MTIKYQEYIGSEKQMIRNDDKHSGRIGKVKQIIIFRGSRLGEKTGPAHPRQSLNLSIRDWVQYT